MGDVVFNGECARALITAGREVRDCDGDRYRSITRRITHDDFAPFTLTTDEPLTAEQARAYMRAGGRLADKDGDHWRFHDGKFQHNTGWWCNAGGRTPAAYAPYTLVQVPEHLAPEPAAEANPLLTADRDYLDSQMESIARGEHVEPTAMQGLPAAIKRARAVAGAAAAFGASASVMLDEVMAAEPPPLNDAGREERLEAQKGYRSGGVTRNTSTPKARELWRECDRIAEGVAKWPDWKRGGINVSDRRAEPDEPKRYPPTQGPWGDEPESGEPEPPRTLQALATLQEWRAADEIRYRHAPEAASCAFEMFSWVSNKWHPSASPGPRPWTRHVAPKRVPAPATLGDCAGYLSVRRASWGRFSIDRNCTTIDQLTAADLAATDWLVSTDGGKTWFSPLGEVDA